MRARALIGLGTLAVAMLGMATSAHATFVETMSGSNCQSVYPPDTANGTGLYHNQNSISNQSGAWRFVTCPIQRVNAYSTAGWTPSVIFTDSSNQLYCYAESMDEFGNVLSSVRGGASQAHPGVLSFSSLPTYGLGFSTFFCVMPPSSTITQVISYEN